MRPATLSFEPTRRAKTRQWTDKAKKHGGVFSLLRRVLLFCAQRIDAERAHQLAMVFLRYGGASVCAPSLPAIPPRYQCHVFGKHLAHPIGLAAGFDKNAQAVSALTHLGFSAVEVGSLTSKKQLGNPKPRLWRKKTEQALINHYGLNNNGIEAACRYLPAKKDKNKLIGVNISYNTTSTTPAARLADMQTAIEALSDSAIDYIAINLSCPNRTNPTDPIELLSLFKALPSLTHHRLVIKISCDLSDKTYASIARSAQDYGFKGLIVGNTSLDHNYNEKGGISGKPLGKKALHALQSVRRHIDDKKTFVLISSGGVMNGNDVAQRIKAGADIVQIYTAFIYRGLDAVATLIAELKRASQADRTT